MKRLLFVLTIIFIALSAVGCGLPNNAASNTPSVASGEYTIVTRVVDGDTIVVSIGGAEYKVRYIGMDTPEIVDPRKPVQCFGKEASIKNTELVFGKIVRLEKDVSDKDMYGRLLRYVWVVDVASSTEVMVNAELIRLGYAQVSTYPPDVKYQDYFLELQDEAQTNNLGLWENCP